MKRYIDWMKEYEDKRYRQYAIVYKGKNGTLMDSEEFVAIENQRGGRALEVTHFPKEKLPYYLVYGLLLKDLKGKEKSGQGTIQAEKNTDHLHKTIYGGEAYLSWYLGIRLGQPLDRNARALPVALLLKTALPIERGRGYGLGFTLFAVRKGYHDIYKEIIDRKYVLCIRDIEKKYDDFEEDWSDDVDREKMIQVAYDIYKREGGDMIEKNGCYS